MIKTFNYLFVTCFGIGSFRFAPGTITSFVTTIYLFSLFHVFFFSGRETKFCRRLNFVQSLVSQLCFCFCQSENKVCQKGEFFFRAQLTNNSKRCASNILPHSGLIRSAFSKVLARARAGATNLTQPGRRRRPVVIAGKAGKTGPGKTKPRRGTTGKAAKPKQAF